MRRSLFVATVLFAACSDGPDPSKPKDSDHPAVELGRRWAAALTTGDDAAYRQLFAPQLQPGPNMFVGDRAMIFWHGELRELEKRGYSGDWEFREEGRGTTLNGGRVVGVIYPILEQKPHYAGIWIGECEGQYRIVRLF